MTALLTAPEEIHTAAAPEPAHTESPYDVDIDRVRYWVGATLTAAIAGLAAMVGITVLTGILGVQPGAGAIDPAVYGLASAGAALGASALYYAMLHVAPRPGTYYGWLAGLLTLLAVVLPFAGAAALASQIGLAGLNLMVGIVVAVLVPIAAVQARQ
jgi:Family of unknown function (DUF6069)